VEILLVPLGFVSMRVIRGHFFCTIPLSAAAGDLTRTDFSGLFDALPAKEEPFPGNPLTGEGHCPQTT
jgi:hypothetical protein